jgi:Ribbon-helix-helix protein, copG family
MNYTVEVPTAGDPPQLVAPQMCARRQRWYHTHMDKTTIYLPTELKSAIKRVARQRGVSEAEVIRDSIRDAVGDDRPRPRGGLFASGAPIAREADEHLPGFGER